MGFSKASGGLCFREFSSFNKALLAKQIWRMWKTPDSLIAKIIKATYHLECSILEAPLGPKPSFAWRSIQSSSDLVREGLMWRIGNGKSIRILGDKWLPIPYTFIVQSAPKVLDQLDTVDKLIDEELRWWNKPLLDQMFTKEEILAILSIPISHSNQEDKQIWRGTAAGIFSIKSAYHIQKEKVLATKVDGSSRARTSNIWKALWKLNLPSVEIFFPVESL